LQTPVNVAEEKTHGKETSLLRKRAAAADATTPRKVRCLEGLLRGGGKATAEESEAIAALEHFKNAGRPSLFLYAFQ